jgi:DNA repair photolyase
MRNYRYSLSLTSQFFYCGLPLRLDTYSACQYGCQYCFARARGGASRRRPLQSADPERLRQRLHRVRELGPRSAVDELLAQRQPIHLGGMTDPFPPAEHESDVTLRVLAVLAEFNYPTVISTKGATALRDQHIELLRQGSFVVQISLSSLNQRLLRELDAGTPSPEDRIECLRRLHEAGISTACRIQPVIPTREKDVLEVITACADARVSHVAVEHLKLPIERRWPGTRQMSRALGVDIADFFISRRARRVGREWVLPVEDRLPRMVAWREAVHDKGLTFGAADNDLLLLSDGGCCCSGIDLMDREFSSFFRFTYTEAVRRGAERNQISASLLDDVWRPIRSVNQYVNSRSRIDEHGSGVTEYLNRGWNGAPNGSSPVSLYGVVPSGSFDRNGKRVYQLVPEVRELLRTRKTSGRPAETTPNLTDPLY